MKPEPRRRQRAKITRNIAIGVASSLVAMPALAATSSRIEDITLYPDSATITRVATVAPGARVLALTCLPTTFDPRTLNVIPDKGVRTGDVRVQIVARDSADGCERTAIETQIRALQDQRRALGVQIRANDLAIKYLENIGTQPDTGKPVVAANLPTLGKALDTLTSTAQAVYEKQAQLKQRDAELADKLAALNSDPNADPDASNNPQVYAISIAVDAPQGGAVRVSYRTSAAGWRPAYLANLDSAQSAVVIERQATLAQATGEDWKGVRIRLSTGQPNDDSNSPTPAPWQLNIITPQPPRATAAGSKAMYMDAVAAPPPAPSARSRSGDEPLFSVATVQTNFSTEFVLPGNVDLPSDAQKVTFTLATQTLPAKLFVRSTPSLDLSAYLIATVAQPDGVWPAGAMQLRHDGATAGAFFWDPTQTGQTGQIDLPFGKDPLVNITADTPKTLQQNNIGFIDKRSQRRYATTYTVRNRHRDAIDIELLEPTPVSLSSDISVTSNFTPQPAERDWQQRAGIIAWRQTLKPGENAGFSADYTITFPKDALVSGLR